MSKRQFKSQASSTRASPGAVFSSFGASSASSALSYLTEPPNLSSISDANVIVEFKNLSKKDGTTKAKALEDLRGYVQAHPYEQDGGTEEPILEAWVKFYPRLSIDNSRRVRELSHNVQFELLNSARKRMEKHIPKIVGSWLAGTYDRDRAVSKAAKDGVTSFLDTDEKVVLFWKRCQAQILHYAQEAINETPQTLSDERTMSLDDIQAKYFRVVGSSISLVVNLLDKLDGSDVLDHQDKYDDFLSNGKTLWSLANCEDAFVRRTTDQLLIICLNKQQQIIKNDLKTISHAFISDGLRASQSTTALQLLQALEKLTLLFPQSWTSAYSGKKTPLSGLRDFVEKGSQGGPPEYWEALLSLFLTLPNEVLPSEIVSSLEFLKSFQNGILSRGESRNNAKEAWSSYFETVGRLAANISDPSGKERLFREAIYPVFAQSLHSTTENSKWPIGNDNVALAKAYLVCASTTSPELQQSLRAEWQRLAGDLVERIQTSQPEQLKDYRKSQDSIIAEGRCWFELLSEILKTGKIDDADNLLIPPSNKIITEALSTLVNRNGKPYSAAATVEVALRLRPSLMEVSPDSLEAVKSFLQSHLLSLILSPSSKYIVSILDLLRLIPNQQTVFENIWQSAIDGLLTSREDKNTLRAITSLITSDAVAKRCQADLELQSILLDNAIRAITGDADSWVLFESSINFNILTESTESNLVDQVLEHLDVDNSSASSAFKALEFISKKKPELLGRETYVQVLLISKLLAFTELSGSELAPRAKVLKSIIEDSDSSSTQADAKQTSILQIIRDNLEFASPQSLSIHTLVKQANDILEISNDLVTIKDLFPDVEKWRTAILWTYSYHCLNPALAVMRPFAGTVFILSSEDLPMNPRAPQRDRDGFSIPLRIAMYTANMLSTPKVRELLPQVDQSQLLCWLCQTAEIAKDQVDSLEDSKLFSSHLNLDVMGLVRDFLEQAQACLNPFVNKGQNWLDYLTSKDGTYWPKVPTIDDTSPVVRDVFFRLREIAGSCTPGQPWPPGNRIYAFYAAKSLSNLISKMVDVHGCQIICGEWSIKDITHSFRQGLTTISFLTALQENLSQSENVASQCNKLISKITSASPGRDGLFTLVDLNTFLAVYHDCDLPVTQNRLVFAVKQILSWGDRSDTSDTQSEAESEPLEDPKFSTEIASESCRALQRLLPAIKTVYGSYWEKSLAFCVYIWEWNDGELADKRIPMIGMSLKLYSVLRNLKDASDDLEDALKASNERICQGLTGLLKLRRLKDHQPLQFVDSLLSRLMASTPSNNFKDLADFYPLVASDFRLVQSTAYDVLHRALPEAQQEISINVLLESKDAKLPEELLSLLLDAPSIHDFSDEEIAEFPSSIRGYLLSWHLVYDSYTKASFKVRNDYSNILKSENYIGPLLDFLFDVLGHSAANALNLDKARFDASMIRDYEMGSAIDREPNERDMQWLLINLYYLCLKYTPSLAKNWWMDCKSKQTRIAVESWTEKFFSPLVIEDTMEEVSQWAEEQESTSSEDEKKLIVKVSKRSREVSAGYEVDDMMMQIAIRLPSTYPLEGVKVDGVNRVAVSEKKFTSWLMITQGVITFSNGSITDGLNVFRKNVTGALKGLTECAICYSMISSDKKMPDKRCQTCKNLFHASCLFKWFSSSNQSTCPLCRNPFNYGIDTSRRARDRERGAV